MSESISAAFPYTHRFVTVRGSRMAYVDEGHGDPIVFLHGNPTSSYLWRNIIPHVVGLGRCIALDLIGMGHSDKPDIGYRFADHAHYLADFLEALGLDRITLVTHDWGTALGFDWMGRHPERVRAVVFMEGVLVPVDRWDRFPAEGREVIQKLRTPGVGEAMILDDNVFIERLLPGTVVRGLTPDEMAHYRAPFHERTARRPMLAWPREIPIEGEPADVAAIVAGNLAALQRSQVPKLLFTAEPGLLIRGELVAWCRAHLPALEVVPLGHGLHYIQEDHPTRSVARWRAGSVGTDRDQTEVHLRTPGLMLLTEWTN